jgi:hypothetical protein
VSKIEKFKRLDPALQTYTVLYRDDSLKPGDAPLAFVCEADDGEHATEQVEDAYPGCEVVWICSGVSVAEAYTNYWGNS